MANVEVFDYEQQEDKEMEADPVAERDEAIHSYSMLHVSRWPVSSLHAID